MKKIILTRDSVCAGDDVDAPHETSILIDENWKIKRILEEVLNNHYLATIEGGKATWSVACENPIAIIAQQWKEPKLICMSDFPFQGTRGFKEIETLHFNYHAQDDPDTVHHVLERYRNK
jgi:hypothetical protein